MIPGTRVAVVDASMKVFLGYGKYLGDFPHPVLTERLAIVVESHEDIPEDERPVLAKAIREGKSPMGRNPRIELDNGEKVWGCECWWGPADQFQKNGHAAKYGAPVDPGSRQRCK